MNKNAYINSVNIDFHIGDDAEKFAEDAARFFSECSIKSIRERGRFVVALSGGNTPAPVWDVLAEKYKQVCEWNLIHFFWSDERYLPPEDERNNYHMAKIHLLDKINVSPTNIHRFLTEFSAKEASVLYSEKLRDFFQLKSGEWPSFDMIFLGLGENGHTASLFPENPALKNMKDFVVTANIPELGETRITFTYPVINAAKNVVVLVRGEEKRSIVQTALTTPPVHDKLPIQGIHPSRGNLSWFLDRAAALSLQSSLEDKE